MQSKWYTCMRFAINVRISDVVSQLYQLRQTVDTSGKSCFQLWILQDGFLRVINGAITLQMALKMGIPGAITPTYRAITGRGPSLPLFLVPLLTAECQGYGYSVPYNSSIAPKAGKKNAGGCDGNFPA